MDRWEEIRRQATITGRITDQEDGSPIAGAQVTITTALAAFSDWLSLKALTYGRGWDSLKKNMDEAFVRRLQIVIEFPMPAEADRRRMWSAIWPRATPLSADIDFDALARFELAGGSIKNVALAAAFLAAADGEVVTMTHLLRATQREFQKMGRILAPGELAIAGSTAMSAIR